MNPRYLEYEVLPNANVPAGMVATIFAVLSPVWRGQALTIVYPDGTEQVLVGITATGASCDLKVFWSRATEHGPLVCLVLGGSGGIRLLEARPGVALVRDSQVQGEGKPLLALADSLIPPAVLAVIGPKPPAAPRLLL